MHLWPNLLGVFYPMPLRGRIASMVLFDNEDSSKERGWVMWFDSASNIMSHEIEDILLSPEKQYIHNQSFVSNILFFFSIHFSFLICNMMWVSGCNVTLFFCVHRSSKYDIRKPSFGFKFFFSLLFFFNICFILFFDMCMMCYLSRT